ncbi:MAG: NADH-quinone oxidoreductase subunit F [Tissierellia bacterium]|nr:NADH-quinone oxidoreductase subunit F [Tissierellia bacterium]
MKRDRIFLTKRFDRFNNPSSVDEYENLDGYKALKKAISMTREEILDEVDTALLRGRGGAGFPAGIKMRSMLEEESDIKYIVCNADEGEPGTFKDGALLQKDPLSVIEGMTISAYCCDAKYGYIYIRGEYGKIRAEFVEAVENARKKGYLGENILGVEGFDFDIKVVSGAGAYVCGENSALLNSIEAKPGRPKVKMYHLAEKGLYDRPTLVNNVETFACLPIIVEEGGQRFLELGTKGGGGTKLISLSGHIKNPGVYEINLGTPMDEILNSEEFGGGSSTGHPIKFIHIGGQSGPLAFDEQLKAEYSYDGLKEVGLSVGSGAIVVLDETVNVVEYLEHVFLFFEEESCGKCNPCRIGTTRIREILSDMVRGKGRKDDIETLEYLIDNVSSLAMCGLGQSEDKAIISALKYRENEFKELALN